tara:strand:- start:165 stop:269 length:105 start_codon:yes stop_codon:yes gene_type:complete
MAITKREQLETAQVGTFILGRKNTRESIVAGAFQ